MLANSVFINPSRTIFHRCNYLLSISHSFMAVFNINVKTSTEMDAGTNAQVFIKIHGKMGVTTQLLLDNQSRNDFERGA